MARLMCWGRNNGVELVWSATILSVGDTSAVCQAELSLGMVFEQLQCSSGHDADAPGNAPCRKRTFTRIFTATAKGMTYKRPL